MSDLDTRDALESAVTSVLWNASNYPECVQSRILGQDMVPLAARVTDAVLAKFLPAHDHDVRVEYEARRKPEPIHVDNIDGQNAAQWLAAHDAETVHEVAEAIRRHATPPSELANPKSDALLAWVADWIERADR